MEDLERMEHLCDLRQEQQQRNQQAWLDQEPSYLGKSITFSQYAYITHIITYWTISDIVTYLLCDMVKSDKIHSSGYHTIS